jgi:hypothetical protein
MRPSISGLGVDLTPVMKSAQVALTPGQTAYRWLRSLHLYGGLFVSPFLLIFALSSIALNHAVLPWGGDAAPEATRTVTVGPQSEEDGIVLVKQLRTTLGLQGEIGFVNRDETENRLSFPIEQPGQTTRVEVDLTRGVASVTPKQTGLWDAMVYLHKKPGPHNVALRGNWAFMRFWAWLADAAVYLLLVSTASGVYLWTVLRAERRTGLLFLGGGVLSFVLVVAAVVG